LFVVSGDAWQTRPHRWLRGCLYLDVRLEEVAVEAEEQIPTYGPVKQQRCECLGELVSRDDIGNIRDGHLPKWCRRCWRTYIPPHTGYKTVRVCWRPTPWAAALPADVVGLWVTDREPMVAAEGRSAWFHPFVPGEPRQAEIPEPVFSLLDGYADRSVPSKKERWYRTPDLARLHLAHALRLWVYGGGEAV